MEKRSSSSVGYNCARLDIFMICAVRQRRMKQRFWQGMLQKAPIARANKTKTNLIGRPPVLQESAERKGKIPFRIFIDKKILE